MARTRQNYINFNDWQQKIEKKQITFVHVLRCAEPTMAVSSGLHVP